MTGPCPADRKLRNTLSTACASTCLRTLLASTGACVSAWRNLRVTTCCVCCLLLQATAKPSEEGSKKRRAAAADEEDEPEPAASGKARKQSAGKPAATAGPQQQSPRRSGRSQRREGEADEDGPAVSGAGVCATSVSCCIAPAAQAHACCAHAWHPRLQPHTSAGLWMWLVTHH